MGTGDRDSTLESGAGVEGEEGNVDTNVRAEERERGGGGGGEGEEGGGPVRGGKKSPFFNILAELTWGQVTGLCKATPTYLVSFILSLLVQFFYSSSTHPPLPLPLQPLSSPPSPTHPSLPPPLFNRFPSSF